MGDKREASGRRRAARAFGVLALVYGVLMLVGAAAGRQRPAATAGRPWSATLAAKPPNALLELKRIKTVADLERERGRGQPPVKSVMLDFYADWCVSCKEMEHNTFTRSRRAGRLANTVLLQADVTANDDEDQALLEHFGIFGPPTIAFFARRRSRTAGLPRRRLHSRRANSRTMRRVAAATKRHVRPVAIAALRRSARLAVGAVGLRGVRAAPAAIDRVAASAPAELQPAESGRPSRNPRRWRNACPTSTLADLDGTMQLAGRLAGQVADREFLGDLVCALPREIPLLDKLQQQYGPDGFQVVGIAVGLPGRGHAYAERPGSTIRC